jgi:hypothetical protein
MKCGGFVTKLFFFLCSPWLSRHGLKKMLHLRQSPFWEKNVLSPPFYWHLFLDADAVA